MTSARQKAAFYGQFATLLGSGMSLTQTFGMLESGSLGSELKKAASHAGAALLQKEDWLEVFEAKSDLFSSFETGLLRVGNESGSLDTQARLLEQWFIRSHKLYSELISHMVFPVMLLVIGWLVGNVRVFLDQGWDPYFQHAIFPMLMVIFLCCSIYLLLVMTYGQSGIEYALGMAVPLMRTPVKKLILARFLRAWASLIRAGVPFPRQLTVAGDAVAPSYLQRSMPRLLSEIDEGATLVQAFTACNLFPPEVLQFIAAGETSGTIDEMAEKSADMLEQEGERQLKSLFRGFSLVFYLLVVGYLVYQVVDYWISHLSAIPD